MEGGKEEGEVWARRKGREGRLGQGFSVGGRRQAKIDWHQRARARVIVISPLILWVFHQEICCSSCSVCSTQAHFIKRFTVLWFSTCTGFIFLVVLLWLYYYSVLQNLVPCLAVSALRVLTQKISQAALNLQLFLVLGLKYFSFQNVCMDVHALKFNASRCFFY